MRITFQTAVLRQAFADVSSVVSHNSPRNSMRCVLLSAPAGKAELSATNGEVQISMPVECIADKPGSCLLPARDVASILRVIGSEDVTISVDGDTIFIDGDAEYRLGVQDVSEFPTIKTASGDNVETKAGPLRNAIRKVRFATEEESTRYALDSVQIEVSRKQWILAATDTRRLAVVEWQADTLGEFKGLLKSDAIALIERTLPADDLVVSICVDASRVTVESERCIISALQVQGKFPPWRNIIPKTNEQEATFLATDLLSAVRQCEIMTSQDSRGVSFEFLADQVKLAGRYERGEVKAKAALTMTGETFTASIDPVYVRDFLQACGKDATVTLRANGGETALHMTCGNYQYVVMPLAKTR